MSLASPVERPWASVHAGLRLFAVVAALAMLNPLLACAQEAVPTYRDDRSDATALITSYYNAINRHEYARAWSYWENDKPSQSYDDFVAGFAHTQQVELATGTVFAEGAAGSLYYSLPVAIAARQDDGSVTSYAGCFALRLGQPSVQAPPFRPLHIIRAYLKPVAVAYEDSVPQACSF